MTFNDLIAARLESLVERHGKSLSGVAREMDKSHTWLARKLEPEARRPFACADVDLVCAHLGESPEVLLEPVLSPRDAEVLKAFVRHPGCYAGSREELKPLYPATKPPVSAYAVSGDLAAARLERQGLITADNHPTPLGRAALEAHTPAAA